ncbi:MAG: hypothetical protein ACR2H0_06190, partial [Candidatus Limnocylindrales bacterium]
MNNRFLRNGIVTLVLVVGTAALLYMFIFPGDAEKPIDYSSPGSSLELVQKGEVTKVTQRGQLLQIETKEVDPATNKPRIKTSLVPNELRTDVQTDVATACQASPSTCTQTPAVVGAPASDGSAWLGILLSALLPILL